MSGRLDYFFRQKVTEAELDLGFDLLEQADRALMLDTGIIGVLQGATLSQKSGTPNLSVDVSGPGVTYDKLGQRIAWGAVQNVPVNIDENGAPINNPGAPGNEIRVSVFAKFKRVLSDPRPDGNSVTVFFNRAEGFEYIVRQGAEGAAPSTPPALDSTYILLGDVKRTFGQTQVLNADIVTTRREDAIVVAGSPHALRRGLAEEAFGDLLGWFNAHVDGSADKHAASVVNYGGGPSWLDTATNPATTAELQFDKLITDLTLTSNGASGAHKTGSASVPSTTGGATIAAGSIYSIFQGLKNAANLDYTPAGNIAAVTIAAALAELDAEKGGLGLANSWTQNNTFTNTILYTSRTRTRLQTASLYNLITGLHNFDGSLSLAADDLAIQVLNELADGSTLTTVTAWIDPSTDGSGLSGSKPTLEVKRRNVETGTITTLGAVTTDATANGAGYQANHSFAVTGLTEVVDRTKYRYYVLLVGETLTGATSIVFRGCTATMTVTKQSEVQ